MRIFHFKKIFFLILTIALNINIIAKENKTIGGEWSIKLTPKPNNTLEHTDKPYNDELSFKSGKMSSKVCTGYGFEASSFTTKIVKGKIEYSCIMKSTKHGSGTWVFVVNGSNIKGTFLWESSGKKASFTFEGEVNSEVKK